jgi:hypothetical protein
MPYLEPGSLTTSETYAVTAFVLHLNGIVDEDFVLDERPLPQMKMPNRDGFFSDPRGLYKWLAGTGAATCPTANSLVFGPTLIDYGASRICRVIGLALVVRLALTIFATFTRTRAWADARAGTGTSARTHGDADR